MGEDGDGLVQAVVREIPNQKLVGVHLTASLVRTGDKFVGRLGFGSPQWVATQGQAMSFDEAIIYFPTIEKGRYAL